MSTIEKFLYNFSLKSTESEVSSILANSLLGKLFFLVLDLIKKFIVPFLKESFTAKAIEPLVTFSIMMLLFISPFVSTDANALLVIVAVLLTTLKHFTKPETIPNKVDPLLLTVLGYFAINLVAAGFSPYFAASLKGFSKMIIYFLSYLVFVANLDSFKNIRAVLLALVASATIVGLYGDYQFYIKVEPYQGALWDDPNATSYRTTRVYSFLKNPNLLAGYLLPTLGLTASLVFLMKSNLTRLIMIGAFFAQLACMYWTYSRGGWLGTMGMMGTFAFSLFIMFGEKLRDSKLWKVGLPSSIGLAIAGVIGILIKSPATLERFTSIFTTRGHSSNSFRMNVWISCWQMFRDNMLIGIGPGNTTFELIYPLYMFSGFKALSAYNIFLETAVETGIIGLIVFLIMLKLHVLRALWGIFSNISYQSKMILAGSLSGLAGLIVQGMFDTVWYRPQVHILFWFLMALIVVSTRDEKGLEG
jgi:putative inorganic carbon (HCO3(-)) transporter